jgi:hypothetical protein
VAAAAEFEDVICQLIDARVFYSFKVFPVAVLLFSLLFCCVSARAQFQSAFVFAPDPKGIAVYTRNDVTGVLTPVAGSPFPSKEVVNVMTLDFSGRFLFTANRDLSPGTISMFTVDPNTGAVQEVPNSPFASAATNAPVFLSVESSGQFLYVIDFNSSTAGASSFETFTIDAANLALVPSSAGATELPGLFVSGATHPSGKSFYAFLNAPFSSIPNETFFLVFDGATGKFTIPDPNLAPNVGTFGCCFALDPQGASLALGTGTVLTNYGLQTDGTLASNSTTGSTSTDATSMSFDSLGRFLYVDEAQPPSTSTIVHFFSVGTVQELPNSPLPSIFPSTATWIVDPTAPLIFANQVYQVDPQTGVPGSILSSSPISPPSIFTRPPGSQPVVGPIAQLSPASLSFGSLTVGQASSALTLTISSVGGQALSLNTITITGTNPGDFSITGDTCHAPVALSPNSSCSELITFTPSATGARSAALTITDNASPSTQSASLSGTGLAPAPAVTLIPGSLAFGNVAMGSSAQQSISVQNSGTAALHISNIALGGANASDYSSSSASCTSAIAVGSSCTATVTFTPAAAGLRSATLTLTDDAPNSPQTVIITGTGLSSAPAVTLVPGSLAFGNVAVGSSAQQSISVQNSGTAALHISNIALGGANASDYSSSSPSCTSAIAVGSSCTVNVTFTPTAAGLRSATLALTDDAPNSPQAAAVSGTGVSSAPAVSFSPATPSFPTTTQGTSSGAQTMTVTNSGNAPLHVSSVSLGGSNASEFSLTNTCNAPIAPAANCTISMVFSPIATGQQTANVMIADDVAGSPQTVPLSAMANPAFTAGAAPGGSTTASVSAGQTAQYQLQLTPGSGYGGTVSLACSGAPTGAVCQAPSTVTISNGVAATFAVSVSTSGPAQLPPWPKMRFVPLPGTRLFSLLALVVFLLLLLRSVRTGRSFFERKYVAGYGLFAATVLYAVLLVEGCGGAGSASVAPPTPPSTVTPSGTSTIVLTLSAMSSAGQPLQLQPIQLTLIVK